MDKKTAKEVFYGSDSPEARAVELSSADKLQNFMYAFALLPREEALVELTTLQQGLVDLMNTSNNSAKCLTYAFLNHAWRGERDWTKEVRNASEPHLKKMRRRKLKTDPITEPWHIDVLYGAFFGSGDPDYLKPVLRLVNSDWNTVVAQAARWSLNSLRGRFSHIEAALTGGEA
jgi:hypothetical protein